MAEKTLTRADICSRLSSEVGFSGSEAADLLDAVLEEVSAALEKGEMVKLSSFGNFVIHHKKARMGRNPKTKVEAPISARRTVTFHVSPVLKAAINGENPDGGRI